MIELRERHFASFFEVPFAAYPASLPYVAPMRSDLKRYLSRENPLFSDGTSFTYFTALRDGHPVGRITAHLHSASNRQYDLRRAYFGHFDCIDDREVAGRLLAAVETWGRGQGCDEIAGNFNFTAMQQVGVVTEGFDATPYTDMTFGPAHLPPLLETHGYEAWFPMTTFETDLTDFDPETLLGEKQRRLLEGPSLRWDRMRRRRLKAQMEDVRRVLNDGFANNPMFVPLSQGEFAFQASEMLWIIDERIACLAYQEDEPVGVVVCIPDLNPFLRATGSRFKLSTPVHFLRHRFRRRRAVILFYSVCRSQHGRGLAGAMLYRVTTALRSAGYRTLGTTWIADGNPASLRQMEKLGAQPLHRLRLYRKPLVAL